MKADFLPYLQPIMPLLLRGAAQDIQFTMEDVQEGEDEDDEVCHITATCLHLQPYLEFTVLRWRMTKRVVYTLQSSR